VLRLRVLRLRVLRLRVLRPPVPAPIVPDDDDVVVPIAVDSDGNVNMLVIDSTVAFIFTGTFFIALLELVAERGTEAAEATRFALDDPFVFSFKPLFLLGIVTLASLRGGATPLISILSIPLFFQFLFSSSFQ
jgi:hypothetical protein